MDGRGRYICSEVALEEVTSTGNPVESAKSDFWKEGEGIHGKALSPAKPAVSGTVPFISP